MEQGSSVYIAGWGDDKLESQGPFMQSLANESGTDAYILHLRAVKPEQPSAGGVNFLREEGLATADFIRARRLKNVTVIGHSQGAPRVAYAENALQSTPNAVYGVALISPVGLDKQHPLALLGRYAMHSGPDLKGIDMIPNLEKVPGLGLIVKNSEGLRGILETATEQARKLQAQGESDLIQTQVEQIKKSFVSWLTREYRNLNEMAEQCPAFAKIKAPVVLVTGLYDRVAARERILPMADEVRVRRELRESKSGRRMRDMTEEEVETGKWQSEVTVKDKTMAARGHLLKDKIFKSAESVQWLAPEKSGNHWINIMFRPEQVAQDALYLLRRAHRHRAAEEAVTG